MTQTATDTVTITALAAAIRQQANYHQAQGCPFPVAPGYVHAQDIIRHFGLKETYPAPTFSIVVLDREIRLADGWGITVSITLREGQARVWLETAPDGGKLLGETDSIAEATELALSRFVVDHYAEDWKLTR